MRWYLAARLYTLTEGDATPVLVPALATHSCDLGAIHRYSAWECMPVDDSYYDLGMAEFSAIPLLELGDHEGVRAGAHASVMAALLRRWKKPRVQTVQWNQLVFDDTFLQTVKTMMKGLDTAMWVESHGRAAVIEAMLVSYIQGRLG